jgi:cytidylate kinase
VAELDYETVAADLARRDALDEGRVNSPLAAATDAIHVDTTDRTVDEVVDELIKRLDGGN